MLITPWRLLSAGLIFLKLSNAFITCPNRSTGRSRCCTTTINAKNGNNNNDFDHDPLLPTLPGVQQSFRAFGIAVAILALNSGVAPHAAASIDSSEQRSISSTSIQIAAEIKTMDFSLPSSYDSISDTRVSGVDELAKVENISSVTKKKSTSTKPPPSEKKFGFPSNGAVMTTKQPKLTDEERAALEAQKAEEKLALAKEKSAERKALADEKAAIAAEKEATKLTEQEAKATEQLERKRLLDEARASEKSKNQEANEQRKLANKENTSKTAAEMVSKSSAEKLSGAKFVDMGLPSYSESSQTGRGKSAFSLK